MAMPLVQSSRAGRGLIARTSHALSRSVHSSTAKSFPEAESSSSSSSAAAAAASSLQQYVTQPGALSTASAAESKAGVLGTSRRQLPSRAIEIGPLQQNRLEEHYNNTLARDLLYMTYEHNPTTKNVALGGQWKAEEGADLAASDATATVTRSPARSWDLASPYTKNRPQRPHRGMRQPELTSPKHKEGVIALDRVVVTAFCKEAITNKQALIPLLAMMRAITGKPIEQSMADPRMRSHKQLGKQGIVRILRAKSSISTFKIRRGLPVGVKVELPSKSGLEFLEILTTFVLPRLRTFNGFPLPPPSQPPASPAAVSGVVSLGLSTGSLSQFPQTEVNWDAYPRLDVGFQVDCITNHRGRGATERARQLLSGLGVPFVRRGL